MTKRYPPALEHSLIIGTAMPHPRCHLSDDSTHLNIGSAGNDSSDATHDFLNPTTMETVRETAPS
jgi:hypothetical protein